MKTILLFILAWTSLSSAYTLVYDVYTVGFKTGKAYLFSTDQSVLVKFKVTPLPFFQYDYTTECVMDDQRGSVRENIIEIINGKTNFFDYSYFDGDFVRTNRTMTDPPQTFTNRWKPGRPLSLFVILDRFIRKYDDVPLDNLIFIREQIDRFIVVGPEKNYWRIKEVNGQYVFRVHYAPLADLLVPDKIYIEKYRFFGINWNIIALRLHSFSKEEDSGNEE